VAAVRMKSLVYKQMHHKRNTSRSTKYVLSQLPKVFCNIITTFLTSSGIDEEIGDMVPDFANDFAGELESITSLLNDTAIEQVQSAMLPCTITGQALQAHLKARLDEEQQRMKVTLNEVIKTNRDLYVQKDDTKCTIDVATLIGIFSGCLIFIALMVRPYGVNHPTKGGGLLVGNYVNKLIHNTTHDCTGLDDPWCYGQSLNELYMLHAFFGKAATTVAFNFSFSVFMCLALKFIVLVLANIIFLTLMFKMSRGLAAAAEPMEVLGEILMGWVQEERHVDTIELHAWSLARRSLCHNEVAMTLDRFDNFLAAVLVPFILVLTLDTVSIVFSSRPPNPLFWYLILLMGFGSLMALQNALRVYYVQLNHLSLLNELQRHIMIFPGNHEKSRNFIKELIQSLEKKDYQAKVLYIPLNPKTHAVVLAYVGSAIAAIVAKVSFGSS